ncbi:hypothetical protein GP486_003628 [Trichoglossum hirsutum]|uniref:NACHT domain-containing protein n=1 Tax=Trichoglossum hirsutum TaxID=265104 RepID=A0A9P8LCR3_9PEZI|nr:hypothetical protein GP486_003628 [Trichoglossum hirsutum]
MGLLRLDQPSPQGVGARFPVDVIAIHGLNGDRERSWTHKSSGTLWLRDLLPDDLPGARIYTYGYDSRIFAKSVMTINDFARDLLAATAGERDSEEALIVAKEESRYMNFLEMTLGILFFGTPHQGSLEADKWSPLASIIKLAYGNMRTDHIKNLKGKSLSSELFSITQSFRSLSSGFSIISVYETKPTIRASIIVPKESALMNLPNEDQIPRNADHRSICTFASSTSDGYTSIVGKMKELLQTRVENHQGFSPGEMACLQELYTSEYEAHRALIETPISGTCTWLLQHPNFLTWLEDTSTSLFWISGGAGCGKSVSTSFIIDTLLRQANQDSISVTICYYFCDDKNEAQRYATSALCGILHQLISSKPSLIKYVLGPYQSKGRRITKELRTLWDILTAALADPAADNVTLIIDALDECEESTRQPLLNWISEFITEHKNEYRNLKIFISSRPEFSIANKLGSSAIQLRMEDEMQSLERDIRTVITRKLDGLVYSSDFTEEIENYLMEKADGTFLWVALTLRLLEESGTSSYEGLMDVLHHAHSGTDLFNVYANILNRIPESRQKEARKVLQIAATASRPLTLEEFNLALVIRPTDQSEYDIFRRLQQDLPRYLLRLCGPFIRIVDRRVHLVHQTAKEFLLTPSSNSAQSFWVFDPTESHFLLAQTCIWYLLFDCYMPRPRMSETSVKSQGLMRTNTAQLSKPKEHIFLEYSATCWPMHFREGQKSADDEMIRNVTRIHDTDDPRYLMWFEIFWSASGFWEKPPGGITPVISASIAGHESVVASLLSDDNFAADAGDQTGSTPLLWASRIGHEAVVKLLLERDDVQVNSKDADKRTPLWWAAWGGNRAVAEILLLRKDIEINSTDIISQTALLVAAWNGHDSIVELLLQRPDIEVDIKDCRGYTPLARAASRGHILVVQSLLAHGQTKLDSKDKDKRTPLSRAAERGHANVVELLIACSGINCDLRDKDGRTALSRAAEAGHVVVARLLLNADNVVADSRDDEGQTPLYWAAGEGREAVVSLLIDRDDVNLDSDYSDGQTPLSRAAERGQETIVGLLLSRDDVNANANDCDGKTPLWWAAEGGHTDVVKLLLARDDVDVNSKDLEGRTPLGIAEANHHIAVAKLLQNRIHAKTEQEKKSAETRLITKEMPLEIYRDRIPVKAKQGGESAGMPGVAEEVPSSRFLRPSFKDLSMRVGIRGFSSERIKVQKKAPISWWQLLPRSLKRGQTSPVN